MKVVVDLRCLGASPWSGVPVYARNLIPALIAQRPLDRWIGFVGGRSVHPPIIRGMTDVFTDRTSSVMRMIEWSLPWSTWPRRFPIGDALLVPNWNVLPAVLPMPTIVIVHDCWIWRLPWDGTLKERLWHRAIRIRRLLAHAAKIVCVSRAAEQELLFFCPWLCGRTRVVHSAPPPLTAHQCTPQCASGPQRRIMVVTDRHQRKNLQAVLRAIDSLDDNTRVDIVGVGAHSATVGCIGRGRRPTVRWLGTVGSARYHQLLAHAHLLIYDSLYEGFGFPPQEALQYGVAVIISSTPALVETAGAFAHAIVNPMDWRALSGAIDGALQRPKTMNTTIQGAPQRTWNDVADDVAGLIQEAVDG